MDFTAEKEELLVAVIPAVIGREHLVVLPHIGTKAKVGGGKVTPVFQAGGLNKGGVQVHVHLVVEYEELGLGVVRAVLAFDYLAVFVPHGRAALENGHRVLGIVVKVSGTEGVLVLVFQLDKVSAEAGHVVVHHILQRGAGEFGAVLDYAHMSDGVDNIGIDVPEGGVAEKVSVVVEELGRAHYFTPALAVLVYKLGALRAYKAHPVRILGKNLDGRQK